MARSMRRAGLDVAAWNRTAATAAPLADDGVRVCDTAEETVRDQDVVVTMLYDADAVLDVMTPLVDRVDGVWLQMSTVGVDGTERVAALAAGHGVTMLDAPVVGTRGPAEQGSLVVLVSGDRSAEPRVRPVLDAVGSRTLWVGDEPGPASALKLAVNSWVGTINAAVGQAVALTRGLGLDPALFLDVIEGGPVGAPYARLKGDQMIAHDYPVAFGLDNVRKDLGLMREAAGRAGVDASLLAAVAGLYDVASAQGHGDDDMAAVHEAF